MIETNDISEEKIKMKQTMEGKKLQRCGLFFLGTLFLWLLCVFTSALARVAVWKGLRKPFNLSDVAGWHLLSGLFAS